MTHPALTPEVVAALVVDTEPYLSCDDCFAQLDAWADRIKGWAAAGQDVFVYCDNDAKVRAPYDAMGLIERITPA